MRNEADLSQLRMSLVSTSVVTVSLPPSVSSISLLLCNTALSNFPHLPISYKTTFSPAIVPKPPLSIQPGLSAIGTVLLPSLNSLLRPPGPCIHTHSLARLLLIILWWNILDLVFLRAILCLC